MAGVLLVEDETHQALAQQQSLRQSGHTVDVVGDGFSALEMLKSSSYDVIVSDIFMPGMNGVAFLRHVREQNQDIPVIFVTGQPDLDTALQAIEGGIFCYLIKPYPMSKLREEVERASQVYALARLRQEALRHAFPEPEPGLQQLTESFAYALETIGIAFQPIVSWKQQRTVAYEALVRNEEPSLARPPDLVAAAAELGRLDELGRVIRASIARSVAALPPDIRIFVNLHPTDLSDDELLSVSAPLSAIAERVVLEITERGPLCDVPDLSRRLQALSLLGYQIAVDDLGEGYSGLHAFVQLEPDIVKLDRCLIHNIQDNEPRRQVVASMIALCEKMSIQIIAEGVETFAERDTLVDLGGDLLQGYLFARPARSFPTPRFMEREQAPARSSPFLS